MLRTAVALLTFAALPVAKATPANPASALAAGDRLYTEGKYEEAAGQYREMLKAVPTSSNAWYNLGNAEYRLGQKGEAALAYERSLALEPGHPEAAYNLAHVRRETGARLSEESTWQRVVLAPEAWLGQRAVPWIAAGALWGALLLLLPLFGRRSPQWVPGVALLLAGLWAGGALGLRAAQGPRWLIVAQQARAQVAPIASAKTLGEALAAGSEVRLLHERGEWVYVVLPDDSRGWLPRKEVEPVIPPASSLRQNAAQAALDNGAGNG